MVIFIELMVLGLCLLLTGKKVKKVIFVNRESIAWAILFGVLYSLIIFLVKQTELGSVALEKFVTATGLQFAILYTIYPFAIAISEEFIFRYFAVNHWGILGASFLFTILHWRPNSPMPLSLFILIFLFGLSQTWLLKKTKTIWSPIIAHLFVTYFLLFG